MPMTSGRFSQLRWLQVVVCIAAMVVALIMAGVGVSRIAASDNSQGFLLIGVGVMILFMAILSLTYSTLILKIESTTTRQLEVMRDLEETLEKFGPLLNSIADNSRISDSARALAHRDQELEALHKAIREDLKIGKWEAAIYLVDEIERRFGYKEEADRLREEVDDARNAAFETRLNEAIDMVESHFQSHEWTRAQTEIDRLFQLMPDNARVMVLQDRMKTLQDEHKQELLLAWEDAVRRCDTDLAIDILKGLDQYLSPAEAQQLQDSARDVFKEKLLQLGIQFRFAVKEKRWQDALSSGLEIIRDYPNTRMAAEVREVLDTLRERARLASEANASSESQISA